MSVNPDADVTRVYFFMFIDWSLVLASVGGEVRSLAWDPRGERLAVLLKGEVHFFSHY